MKHPMVLLGAIAALCISLPSIAEDSTPPPEQFGGMREDQPLMQDGRDLYPKSEQALVLEDEGEDLLDMRNYAAALAKFEASLAVETSYVAAMNKAVCLVMLKRFEEAIRVYQNVITSAEGNDQLTDLRANAYFGLAEAAFEIGQSEQSCTNIALAIALAPTPLVKNTFATYEQQKYRCDPDRTKI